MLLNGAENIDKNLFYVKQVNLLIYIQNRFYEKMIVMFRLFVCSSVITDHVIRLFVNQPRLSRGQLKGYTARVYQHKIMFSICVLCKVKNV